jgi:hypothetical protein
VLLVSLSSSLLGLSPPIFLPSTTAVLPHTRGTGITKRVGFRGRNFARLDTTNTRVVTPSVSHNTDVAQLSPSCTVPSLDRNSLPCVPRTRRTSIVPSPTFFPSISSGNGIRTNPVKRQSETPPLTQSAMSTTSRKPRDYVKVALSPQL